MASFDQMSIGLAIFLAAIIGFAIYSRGFRRAALIAVGVIGVAVALLFYHGSTQGYRDCVALMWDRKHPAEVKRRQEEARLRICEAYRIREGDNCDCTLGGTGQPGQCVTPLTSEEFSPAWGEKAANPCDPLSLEDLRRADAEASRDKPPR